MLDAQNALSPPRRLRAVALCLVTWIAYISFRVVWLPARPGIDPTWEYAINQAGPNTFAFGRDLVWMWGPLGWLMMTQSTGAHLWYSACMAFGLHALFIVCLVHHAKRCRFYAAPMLFALGYGASLVLGLLPEHPLVGIFALMCTMALDSQRAGVVYVAAAFAAFVVFIKLSAAVVGIAFVALTLMVFGYERRAHALRDSLVSLALFAGITAALGHTLFADATAFRRWVRLSLDLVAGYDEAISLVGPGQELYAALGLLAALGLATAYAGRARLALFGPMALSAFGLFASYKHGFMRHDSPHFRSFSCGTLIITAVWALRAHTRRELQLAGAAVVSAVLVAFGAEHHMHIDLAHARSMLSGRQATDALRHATHPATEDAVLKVVGDSAVAGYALPEDWLRAIAAVPGNRLTPVPAEIAYCRANAVRCAPIPTLQLLASYTARLDGVNADFIDVTDKAPTSIVLEHTAIDDHSMYLEAPRFWQHLWQQFDVVKRDAHKLLLQRRQTPWAAIDASFGQSRDNASYALGAWMDVPRADTFVFAELDVERSVLGRLWAAAYKLPALTLEMRTSDGEVVRRRLIRRVACNGILANALAQDLTQTAELFAGIAAKRITALRVVVAGDKTAFYSPNVKVRWQPSSWPLAPRGRLPR